MSRKELEGFIWFHNLIQKISSETEIETITIAEKAIVDSTEYSKGSFVVISRNDTEVFKFGKIKAILKVREEPLLFLLHTYETKYFDQEMFSHVIEKKYDDMI